MKTGITTAILADSDQKNANLHSCNFVGLSMLLFTFDVVLAWHEHITGLVGFEYVFYCYYYASSIAYTKTCVHHIFAVICPQFLRIRNCISSYSREIKKQMLTELLYKPEILYKY